ncbi:ORF60 [callitrichine gammaherpesvirus 3]|uniref:ORF60 n=1 Tax=callitrichine gammaherpesvirus 3 TaxID=106331 RepID=Q8BEN6_9GAMA|nr:ORF60 [callitrichine gammaherpesvirus 3]AAN64281.1 ORF60 [callitrichine gammaherpesvirus 3]
MSLGVETEPKIGFDPTPAEILVLGLGALQVSFTAFRLFVLRGCHESSVVPDWLASLAEDQSLFVRWAKGAALALNEDVVGVPPSVCHDVCNQHQRPGNMPIAHHSQTRLRAVGCLRALHPLVGNGVSALCNVFLLVYFLTVRELLPAFSDEIMAWIYLTFPYCEGTRSVSRGYRSHIRKFFCEALHRANYDPPLIKIDGKTVERYFSWKNRVPGLDQFSFVPVPAINDSDRSRTLPGYTAMGGDEAAHDDAALRALQGHASTVCCGNPVQWMWFRLLAASCCRSRHCLLPVPIGTGRGKGTCSIGDVWACSNENAELLSDVFSAVVSRATLSCILDIPPVGPYALKCFRGLLKHNVPRACFCLDCGYCLNFGKSTRSSSTFKPSSYHFYPRDQKEKHTLVCNSSGRVYCSNCGSADLGSIPLVEPPSGEGVWGAWPRIRAVLPHNAAYDFRQMDRPLDVVVPCLGGARTCARPTLVRGMTIRHLLYLTLPDSLDKPRCFVCAQKTWSREVSVTTQRPDGECSVKGFEDQALPDEQDAIDTESIFPCFRIKSHPRLWCAGCRLFTARYGRQTSTSSECAK